jgi:hypothetical protein
MRKILIFFLEIIAFLNVSYATDFTYNGLEYTVLTDSTCKAKSGSYHYQTWVAGNSVSGELTIPGTVYYNGNAYSVTSIGNYAFFCCEGLTSVTIPKSVTSIGDHAFAGCTALQKINITDIASWCAINFYDESSNPLFYAHRLYLNGTEVKELVIPETVTSIGKYAFCKYTDLNLLTIPNSVKSIGESAFYGCTGLTGVTIPNSVTEIGDCAFQSCTGLTGVTISNSVTEINSRTFQNCAGLKDMTIPNSVKSIGTYAFYGCTGLTEVTIPNSVTSIGGSAFEGCSGLTVVTIPNSVKSIGTYAFYGCTGLKCIECQAVTPPSIYSSTFSNYSVPLLAASDAYRTANYWRNFTNIGITYTPTSTTFEVDGLKYEIISINDLTCRLYAIDETVTGENVVIPGTVVFKNRTFTPIEIKGVLVKGDSSVKSLLIPSNMTTISTGTIFMSTLEKLRIGSPITTNIACMSNIDEFVITPPATQISNDLSNNIINKIVIEDSETELTTTQFKCSGTKEVYLGRNVSASTFKDMTSLKKVTISDKVTEIGKSAFEGCSGLERVNISDLSAWCNIHYTSNFDNPLYYAYHLFLDGTEVTNLVIPETVTEIKFAAFIGCSGLTEVTIPNSVTSIGKSAFSVCSGLTEVSIPNSVTSIGNYAFQGCTGIVKLTFKGGEGNLTIGTSPFKNVTPTEVYFGRQIDFSVVSHTAFETVEFGENVTSIASGAFKDGTAIRTVVSRNVTPPTTEDPFDDTTYLEGVLYVPDASIEAYQAAAGWKNFWEIKPLSEYSGVEGVVVDEDVETISVDNGAINVSGDVPVHIVALNGTTVYSGRGGTRVNVAPGIYIVIVNGKSHKVAV